ncbi:unnamed protein product [Linum trigynum]
MHCNACERVVAKTISKFKGVEKFTTQMHKHKVVVTGRNLDPQKLLKKLRKKTGKKRAEIVAADDGGGQKEKVDDDGGGGEGAVDGSGMEMVTTTPPAGVLVPFYYCQPDYYYYVWPWRHPSYEVYFTAFSDENANACLVM